MGFVYQATLWCDVDGCTACVVRTKDIQMIRVIAAEHGWHCEAGVDLCPEHIDQAPTAVEGG